MRETIESILVAFILAFIFRAFVVEAFVIPTGSMAPTLYGAHVRLRCPDCGYTFDVGYSTGSHDDTNIPSEAARPAFRCPNCDYVLSSVPNQAVRFGDRILVLKYLNLFQPPQRWDVVVFKSPDEADKHDKADPEYAQNYIKRLVGLPNESILILDGDVYKGPFNADHPADFQIERKSSSAQMALWRMIYDNDYLPQGLERTEREAKWQQPWRPVGAENGWNLNDPAHPERPSRTFTFDNLQGSAAIAYEADDPHWRGFNDWLSYDVLTNWGSNSPTSGGSAPRQPVSDLKLSCFYRRREGDGPLRMVLSKTDDCFVAELSRGKARLLRSKRVPGVGENDLRTEGERALASVDVPELATGDFEQVEFSNVDYRVTLRIHGREVLTTSDAQYSPNVEELWKRASGASQDPFPYPIARIEGSGQRADIQHLQLARDIYYLNYSSMHPTFWASPRLIMHLNAGEYFVLGDNSLISGDARFWHVPVDLPREGLYVDSGRVPERFMLGRAFFVYWPAGYRPGSWIPYAIIPDFAEMRFIH